MAGWPPCCDARQRRSALIAAELCRLAAPCQTCAGRRASPPLLRSSTPMQGARRSGRWLPRPLVSAEAVFSVPGGTADERAPLSDACAPRSPSRQSEHEYRGQAGGQGGQQEGDGGSTETAWVGTSRRAADRLLWVPPIALREVAGPAMRTVDQIPGWARPCGWCALLLRAHEVCRSEHLARAALMAAELLHDMIATSGGKDFLVPCTRLEIRVRARRRTRRDGAGACCPEQ